MGTKKFYAYPKQCKLGKLIKFLKENKIPFKETKTKSKIKICFKFNLNKEQILKLKKFTSLKED